MIVVSQIEAAVIVHKSLRNMKPSDNELQRTKETAPVLMVLTKHSINFELLTLNCILEII